MGFFDWFKKPTSNTQAFTASRRAAEPEPPAPVVQSAFQPNSNTIAENRAKSNRAYREEGAEGWIWLANFNYGTCPWCIMRSGNVYPVEQEFEPCHEGCRCTMIAKTKPLSEILGDPSIPDTRPKIVPGDIWFEKQPEALQRNNMGDDAYEAWKASGLGFRQYMETYGWGPTERDREDWAGMATRQQARADKAAKKYPKKL